MKTCFEFEVLKSLINYTLNRYLKSLKRYEKNADVGFKYVTKHLYYLHYIVYQK